jgi:hypothetical protein
LGGGVKGVEESFLDSGGMGQLLFFNGLDDRELRGRRRVESAGKGRERTHFEMCPSRNNTVFICERRSGSWVVGVYVETALGSLTGVVGSDAIVVFV